MQELFDAYPIIKDLGQWLGGAVAGVLLLILTNRRALLTYNVSHQRIGMTADDEIHGKVEVTFRGNVVHNLYLSTVTVRNSSIRDLENIDLKACRGHENMLLLTEQTAIENAIEYVPLTQEYLDRIERDLDFEQQVREANTADEPENKNRLDADARFRHGQRHYMVRVLNRGQSLRLTYVVHAAANVNPAILVACNSKGVRIKEKPYPMAVTHLWGVPIRTAAVVGVWAALVIWLVILWTVPTLWVATLICIFVGVFGNVWGAAVVRVYDWLRLKVVG